MKPIIMWLLLILVACRGFGGEAIPEGFAILADRSGVVVPADARRKPVSRATPWHPTKAERERGFAVHPVDSCRELDPDWLWEESVPRQRLEGFLFQGQYRAFALALRTLRPVEGIRAEIGDLRSPAGRRFSGRNVDIRVVQAIPHEEKGHWVWRGKWLERPFPLTLPGDWTSWWWITVAVPRGTVPGLYRGNLTIREARGGSVSLPFRLRVLDLELVQPPVRWGVYMPGHFHGPDRGTYKNYADPCLTPDNIERYFRFWRTRGLNSPTLYHVYPGLGCVNGHAVADFGELGRFAAAMRRADLRGELCLDLRFIEFWAVAAGAKLEAIRKAGGDITGDLGISGENGVERDRRFSPEAKRLFAEVVRQLLAQAQREHWPPLRLLVEEEVGFPTLKTARYDAFMPVLLKEAPRRAYLVDNAIGYGRKGAEAIDRGVRDGLRVRQYNNWTEEALAAARRDGAQIWSYNLGWPRAAWGWYLWRTGSTGYHQWADRFVFNNAEGGWIHSLITPQGVVTSVSFERAREGVEDYRTFATLAARADRLDARGLHDAAREIRDLLAETVADVPINRYAFFQWRNATTGRELDRRLWRLVLALQRARRLLGESVASFAGVAAGTPAMVEVVPRPSSGRKQALPDKVLCATRIDRPPALDGRMREAYWHTPVNSTGSLWWTGSTEAAMRAKAGSEDEFRRLPLPSAARAQMAYDDRGLYVLVAANHATEKNARCEHGDDDPDLWKDDCMEFFFEPRPDVVFQLIVNVRGRRVLKKFQQVVEHSGITTATVSPINASGGYSQEIFIPWKAFGLIAAPPQGTSWPMNVGREFHSYRQITTWAPIVNLFSEKARWGALVFGGPAGPVAIREVNLGSRFPGRNRLHVDFTVAASVQAEKIGVCLRDEHGREVARTAVERRKNNTPLSVTLPYVVPRRGTSVSWRLEFSRPGGEVLSVLPVPIPAAGEAVSITACPAFVVSGDRFEIQALIRVGDLDAPGSRLTGRLAAATGRVVSLAPASLRRGGEQRIGFEAAGMTPGRWTLQLGIEGRSESSTASAGAVFQVLPSPYE